MVASWFPAINPRRAGASAGDDFYREQDRKKKEQKRVFGSVANSDEFAKIGLGAGRGGFNVQKQLLDETKLQTAILREANKNLRKLA